MSDAVSKKQTTVVTEVFNARSVVMTLEKLMNDVTKDECSPKTVNAACNCAARITDIIRLHIDAQKVSKHKTSTVDYDEEDFI